MLRNLLFFTDRDNEPAGLAARLTSFVLALLMVSLVFFFAFHQLSYHWNFQGVYQYRVKFFNGWLVTVGISVSALVLSMVIGVVFAFVRRSRLLPLRYVGTLYVELVRGTPLLVQVLVFFYVVASAFHVDNRYLVGILILALFAGAYISEIIRAGIESVGQSQWDSARAIGLTNAQTYRYVVFPQALRQILPPLTGQFVSLIKDSSLLMIIGVNEFTLNVQQVNTYTFSSLEGYLPLALGYLILTLPLSLWIRRLEQKVAYAT